MRLEKATITLTPIGEIDQNADIASWLNQQGFGSYFLAHTLSGVVWGKNTNDGWKLSDSIIKPTLGFNLKTVIQLRLFDKNKECFAWREGTHLRGRTLVEEACEAKNPNDLSACFFVEKEQQILWGTKMIEQTETFTIVEDGLQGMRHAFPFLLNDEYFDQSNHRPCRLHIHHYIEVDSDTGLTRIRHSRLCDVEAQKSSNMRTGDTK